MFKKLAEAIKKKPIIGWGIFAVVMVGVFLLGLLAASITERRAEIVTLLSNRNVEIAEREPNSHLWGVNFPREYNTWLKTQDMDFTSKHMGNTKVDVLEARPAMVVMWAGYAFSRDYTAPRGHMHALEDMRESLRTGTPDEHTKDMQPGTCWTCKGPDVPRLMHEQGIAEFYKSAWSANGDQAVNPIGCADCHDPHTMNLVITRPALAEAFERQGKDISKASPQEMRSLACAQCHVEYHFGTKDEATGRDKYLMFPWDEGMTMEAIEKYHDDIAYVDWTHAISGAPMLKAQHPDYELFLQGPHSKRGVSCADCHMPYKSEGGVKYSDHQVVSPLKNIANTCQNCHRESEDKLKNYVYEYQDKALEIRDRIEQVLPKAHIMAKIAKENGATDAELLKARQLLRQAQWRWDFVVASHGATFHAPVESQRILAHSLDRSRDAEIELMRVLYTKGITEVNMPDISTKAKAQTYIGLDMPKLQADKDKWLKTVVPKWLEKAKKEGRITVEI